MYSVYLFQRKKEWAAEEQNEMGQKWKKSASIEQLNFH